MACRRLQKSSLCASSASAFSSGRARELLFLSFPTRCPVLTERRVVPKPGTDGASGGTDNAMAVLRSATDGACLGVPAREASCRA
eukprot:3941305-Rhodomonas_salina.4